MKKIDDMINLVAGDIDDDRRDAILSEIKKDPEDLESFRKLKISRALLSSTKPLPEYRIEKSFRNIQHRIDASRPSFRMTYFQYAAVFVLFLGMAAAMFYLGRSGNRPENIQSHYTSVVADYGQISKVVLPDSSVIWLNSGTTLVYNNNYGVSNRELNLRGQAFFDVRKNKELPFLVSTEDGMNIIVKGTRFDVKAYPEDRLVNVVLESGSIQLLNPKLQHFDYIMKPGEMMQYNSELKKGEISQIDPVSYISWKDGELVFKNEPMGNVIKKLERKFNIEIVVGSLKVYNSLFTATFTNESLTEILDYIEFSCPITCKIIQNKENKKSKVMFN